jgi:hypothetical protein
LTAAHLEQIEALTGQKVERVVEVRTQLDPERPFVPQVRALVDSIGFRPEEWQTVPLLVHPPSLHVIAVTLLAELHRRMGYFPAIVRLKPVPGSTPPRFEVAEVINPNKVQRHMVRRILPFIVGLAIALAVVSAFHPAVIEKIRDALEWTIKIGRFEAKGLYMLYMLLMFGVILIIIYRLLGLHIKRIPVGDLTWFNILTLLCAYIAAYQAGRSAEFAYRAIAEPKFTISFESKIYESFDALHPYNGVIIYPPPPASIIDVPAYRIPPKTLVNVVSITNSGEIIARNVQVRLRLNDPFIFVNIWFERDEHPDEWRVTPDKEDYRTVRLERLEPIYPNDRVIIGFAYTYPKAAKKPAGTGALEIRVDSAGMRASGVTYRGSLDMKYWGEEE